MALQRWRQRLAVLALLAAVAALRERLRERLLRAARRRLWSLVVGGLRVHVSSPLRGTVVRPAAPMRWGWRVHCPCCRRPADVWFCEDWEERAPARSGLFAYVINLWGGSPSYVLGALVLGHSIRRTGSKHQLICLHTSDVPAHLLLLLARVWDCRLVEHVEATHRLLVGEPRFERVFTKLRALGLEGFDKILVLDIDLLVRSNVDDLFELPAPAAMKRCNNGRAPYRHGDAIDGAGFFRGSDDDWAWGVGSGINAGVMLLQPSQRVLGTMLGELREHDRPSHIRGAGPEQDYLSRFYADSPWTHIGVENNFQLHHLFIALCPDKVLHAERVRLLQTPEQIRVVHFSGPSDAKPWSRILGPEGLDRLKDSEYAQRFLEMFDGYKLWVQRDRASFESGWNQDAAGMYVGPGGEMYRRDPSGAARRLHVPESAAAGAVAFVETALREWFDAFESLQSELGLDLGQALLQTGERPGGTGGL